MPDRPLAACDRELLRRSLGDSLSDGEEEKLARHLSECVDCRQELERLAGDEKTWLKVSSVLKREAESPGTSTSGPATIGLSAPAHADRVAHRGHSADTSDDADVDFAVDFLEPSPSPDAIGRLADIDILEVIGHGGMGIVLKGYQAELKRLVAVKVLSPHLAVSGAARKRFAREAQAAAAILHPNVMPILTVNSTGKLPFLVMPYVACESLQQRIAREGALKLADILRIGMQTAGGLAAAHAQGLVHRDVKPANILLEMGIERVMLTDFGLARAVDDASVTRTGIIAGTPQFMSPEQARGEALDARSDLFSLGSVLYTMAAGRPPFRAETSFGLLRRITDTEPRAIREVNSEIPIWFAAIVAKLHAKDPGARFRSADEVARLLESCLAHVQQPTVFPLPKVAHDFLNDGQLARYERFSRTIKEAWRRSRASSRVRISAALAIAMAVIVSGIVLIAGRFFSLPTDSATRQHVDSQQAATAPSVAHLPAAPVDSDSNATAWDDLPTQELSQLKQDVAKFERESARFWNSPLSTGASGRSDALKQPLNQELRK